MKFTSDKAILRYFYVKRFKIYGMRDWMRLDENMKNQIKSTLEFDFFASQIRCYLIKRDLIRVWAPVLRHFKK